jgi:hypothetical protein
MKLSIVILILALAATAAMAQSQPRNGTNSPVVASPFQALGNVIRNPDADPPRKYTPRTTPAAPPTIIPPGTLTNPQADPRTPPQR